MSTRSRTEVFLVWLVMILAFVPLLGWVIDQPLAPPLSRSEPKTMTTPLNWQTWSDGSFQTDAETYLNYQAGLFPLFVRIHNQLEYSLFKKVNTAGVVAGKNNYLFEKAYIQSYFGQDYLGHKKIHKFAKVMKELQDTLASMNKLLVFVMATGKANYYPEYLPYTLPMDTTNHGKLVAQFDQLGVNYINTIPWFRSMKDTLGHLLFPQYGIHWSYYGSTLAGDTLVKYIEHSTGWDLPDFTITARTVSPKTRYFDNDIASAMNLFVEPEPNKPMVYPDFKWNTTGKDRKKAVMISDSFGWDMFENQGLHGQCFPEMQFWFYNQTVNYTTQKEGRDPEALPVLTRHLNLSQVIQEHDVFIILANEPNVAGRSWGFAIDALESLKNPNYVSELRANGYLLESCKNKAGWRRDLEIQAQKRGISLDSVIQLYLYDRQFKIM